MQPTNAGILPAKTCTKCGKLKGLGAFHHNAATRDGRSARCKQCICQASRDYRNAHPDEIRQKNRDFRESNRAQVTHYFRRKRLEREWGITLEEFEAILAGQGGTCAICRREPSTDAKGRKWHIDHDHKTGKIRGVLCAICNQGLGYFHDDPSRLQAAIDYLGRPE